MKVLLFSLAMIHSAALAQLDQHQQQGLKDTKEFLKDPNERQKFISKDPKAQDVDKKVDALAGSPQNKEEIYGIAADIMERIAVETKGDPAAMQKLLLEAQGNPQVFYQKYFDEKSKARVRGVAADIDKKNSAPAPGPK